MPHGKLKMPGKGVKVNMLHGKTAGDFWRVRRIESVWVVKNLLFGPWCVPPLKGIQHFDMSLVATL